MYVTTGRDFDERRNTSRTFAVPPDALPRALATLRATRGEPWAQWVRKRARGEHDHAAVRRNGERAACPVWGCRAVEDELARPPASPTFG